MFILYFRPSSFSAPIVVFSHCIKKKKKRLLISNIIYIQPKQCNCCVYEGFQLWMIIYLSNKMCILLNNVSIFNIHYLYFRAYWQTALYLDTCFKLKLKIKYNQFYLNRNKIKILIWILVKFKSLTIIKTCWII